MFKCSTVSVVCLQQEVRHSHINCLTIFFADYIIKKLICQLIEGSSLKDLACSEVYPVALLIGNGIIAGNFHSRNRTCKWSSSTGGEQNDLGTGTGQGCCSTKIISGCAEKVKSAYICSFTILQLIPKVDELGCAQSVKFRIHIPTHFDFECVIINLRDKLGFPSRESIGRIRRLVQENIEELQASEDRKSVV